jgi:LysM repeat protein
MKINEMFWVGLCGLCIIGLSGCETMTGNTQQMNQQVMRQREDVRMAREDTRRLTGQVADMERQLAELQQTLQQTRAELVHTLDERVAVQNREIEGLNAARIKDREEVVRALSARLEEILAAQQTARSSASPRSASSPYSIEHTVQPGETLWAIAKAYNVTTKAITEANNLARPDALQVGQKIIIPQ